MVKLMVKVMVNFMVKLMFKLIVKSPGRARSPEANARRASRQALEGLVPDASDAETKRCFDRCKAYRR